MHTEFSCSLNGLVRPRVAAGKCGYTRLAGPQWHGPCVHALLHTIQLYRSHGMSVESSESSDPGSSPCHMGV